jgi:ADP-ribose pyrophosphatase
MAYLPPIHARRIMGSNRYFQHVEEDLGLADASRYTYSFIESHWDAVVVLPVLDDGRLVLERIYRHPYRQHLLECPAGGLEAGEDPQVAAARELAEETGYRCRSTRLLGSFETLPGLIRQRLHVVLASGLEGGHPRQLEAMELIEVVVMDRAQAWAEAERLPASSFLVMGLLYLERALASSGRAAPTAAITPG